MFFLSYFSGVLINVQADQWGYPTESPNGVITGMCTQAIK